METFLIVFGAFLIAWFITEPKGSYKNLSSFRNTLLYKIIFAVVIYPTVVLLTLPIAIMVLLAGLIKKNGQKEFDILANFTIFYVAACPLTPWYWKD